MRWIGISSGKWFWPLGGRMSRYSQRSNVAVLLLHGGPQSCAQWLQTQECKRAMIWLALVPGRKGKNAELCTTSLRESHPCSGGGCRSDWGGPARQLLQEQLIAECFAGSSNPVLPALRIVLQDRH